MAGTPVEQIESRATSETLNTKESTRVWKVTGEKDPSEALKLGPALNDPHPDDANMIAVRKSANHIDGAYDTCELIVIYTLPDQSPASRNEYDKEISFDTTAQTVHISKALDDNSGNPLQNGYKKLDGGDAGDEDGLIGTSFEPNSEPAGVDVYAPSYTHVETWWLPSVSDAYKQTIFGLSGKVNDAYFKGFSEGEMLFLGAVGARRGYGLWRVTYRFLAIKNKADFEAYTVPGTVTIPFKEGWQYLWGKPDVFEGTVVGAPTFKEMKKGPAAIFVATVYEKGNFASINIGT